MIGSNFDFLLSIDSRLAKLGQLSEHYFHDDPSTSLIKLRQFCELLTQIYAANVGLLEKGDETQAELLRRFKFERAAPDQVLDVLHHIRKTGNRAVHKVEGTHRQALNALKMSVQLGVWFYRVTNSVPQYSNGPFIPPAKPERADQELLKELEELRRAKDEALTEAERAQQLAKDERLRAETAAEKEKREAEERAEWEAFANQLESEKNEIAKELQKLQAQSLRVDASEKLAFVQASHNASSAINLDEASTRQLIDSQLRDWGWEANTQTLRHSKGSRPTKGKALAIAEWPTESGPADYALFVDLECVGVVEAKRYNKNVSAVIDQAERYSQGIKDFDVTGSWEGGFKVPFVFSTNGRPYLKQLETESGIWFRDVRLPTNHRRALVEWFTPEGLKSELAIDRRAAQEALESKPFSFGFQLRPYQRAAIEKVEEALAGERRKMLVAMATGTGKTKLAIAMLYRLLSTQRFRRICFVVDRSALGNQTSDEFMSTAIEGPKTFGQIFGIMGLADIVPESETRVHICTIQGLVRRVLYSDQPENVPPIDQYDLMVIDECHRGYLLDREMSDAELSFRGQDDYISKYRRVLEYFDAVKIGLTATPALHTAQIFGDPIYTYTYREAVIDGWLIDHEPPVRIETALSAAGITFEEGEDIEVVDTATGDIDEITAPDELNFQVEAFNRKVITQEFNRVVAEELAQHIDPSLPGKTLIFAATDAHADIVVDEVKKAFRAHYGEIEDAAVKKITGSVDKVGKLIRSYRNDAFPKVAVTVDLLTTGIDVPSITNIVFIRRVNSRILYEQMLGRATRRCDDIGKQTFRIFDAVDLYSKLQDLTQMKPVASNPSLTFEQLFEELERVEEAEQQELVRDQILAKLHRRLRAMPSRVEEALRDLTGEGGEVLRDRLKQAKPSEAADLAKRYTGIGQILDWNPDGSGPNLLPISTHGDQLKSVTRGYGDVDKPEDFLDTFRSFVTNNQNKIAALSVVVQRPRDLTRNELRNLRLELDKMGFSEANLRRAWSDASNEEIAASIIGFVRQAALGDALIPFGNRVQTAVKAILAKGSWTDPQKTWLRRIAEQIEKEIVVDSTSLDEEPFKKDGGFNRLNRVFNGELESILSDFNEELWKVTG